MYLSIHYVNIALVHQSNFTGLHSNEKYHDAGRCTLHIDIDNTSLHFAFCCDGLHLSGDVVEVVVGGGGYLDGIQPVVDKKIIAIYIDNLCRYCIFT